MKFSDLYPPLELGFSFNPYTVFGLGFVVGLTPFMVITPEFIGKDFVTFAMIAILVLALLPFRDKRK